jgi:geranylgeranyl diphosphate synthase type II
LAVRGFELLAGTGRPDVVSEVAQAIGAAGMIGGQIADLEAEGQDVSVQVVNGIHRRKTAALFRACAKVGGMLTNAPDATLQALATFGENLGVAFQIVDDLLDLEGETDRLGKHTGADVRRGKATYPGASSVEAARRAAASAAHLAEDALEILRDREALATLLNSAVRREG